MHVSAKRLTRGPALLLTLLLVAVTGPTQARESYSVAWTLYAGSMPLAYAEENGILEKWGDRYGFDLEAVQMNDYVEAITQFSLGQFDAVIAMSLDALTIPAASGVDTTVILPLSTSHGSSGLVLSSITVAGRAARTQYKLLARQCHRSSRRRATLRAAAA